MKKRITKQDAEIIAGEISLKRGVIVKKEIEIIRSKIEKLALLELPEPIKKAFKANPEYFRTGCISNLRGSYKINSPILSNEYYFEVKTEDVGVYTSKIEALISEYKKNVFELEQYIYSFKTYKKFESEDVKMYNKIPKDLKSEINSTEVLAINYEPLKKYFKQ
ncbi:MAG: hypothetical protein S4CHLAM20_04010 [Chlamydiia bacterium]|nr:hypothetical protein [Chlamydiia bacterium]